MDRFLGSRFLVLRFICRLLAELELEELSLYLCTDQATRFVRVRGRNCDMRLLDVPNRVREAVEFGVHWGAIVALAITQLYFGGNLHDIIGLPARSTPTTLDLLSGDFDAATNVVLG